MERILSPVFWTFWFLIFTLPVTLVLIAGAVVAARSQAGRSLRALDGKTRLLALCPSLVVIALWGWTGAFGAPQVPNGVYDSPELRAAAGWHHSGLYILFGLQVMAVIGLPLLLPRNSRRAAWAYGVLQLWVGAMAASLAHYAVLGLPVPVL